MKKILSLLLLLSLLLTLAGCPALDDPTTPPDGDLTIHYIDVGQADCALIESDGEYILIDGGNVADSSLVVSYLQKQGVQQLSAVICTHAHEDHVGGLPGVLAVYPTQRVYAPTKTYSSKCFDDFLYYTDQQGLEVIIPEPGDYLHFGGATMTVLGPVDSYADPNNTSIVVRIDYGTTRFLFTGDMETQAEDDMLDYWGEHYDWNVDVLKVGHHGSETSSGYRLLRATHPTYGIISVGEGNSYGHPNESALSRLQQAEVTLYRTDKLGSIIAHSDGTNITFTWESGNSQPVIPPTMVTDPSATSPVAAYIGNKNTLKLHLPTCSSLPKEDNRAYFDDYDTAISEGYVPCSKCIN